MTVSTDAAPLAWLNECDGWLALGRRSSAMYRVEVRHGLICAWRTADLAYMPNYIHVPPGLEEQVPALLKEPDLKTLIESGEACTEIRCLAPGGRAAKRLASALAEAGFVRCNDMPLMVRDWKTENRRETGAGLAIRRIDPTEDRDGFAEAFDVIRQSFGGPDVLNRFFVPDDGTVIPYVAHVDGRAVSAAVVWPFRNVYGIYSVSTLEAYRGRGFATMLLRRMLQDGRDFAFSSLRTTDALIPLYGRVGYRVAGRCLCFRNRVTNPARRRGIAAWIRGKRTFR